jgi:anti-sigma regulatory factor (Ser/Thr protein kinase)
MSGDAAASRGARAPFVHRALLYRDEADMATEACRFLVDALERGGLALAVLEPPEADVLQEALGPAARDVQFAPAGDWYRRLGPLFHRLAGVLESGAADGRGPLRVVAGHPAPVARPREYARYEAMANVAFAPFDAGLMCLYDASQAPEPVIADVRRTHPELTEAGVSGRSREFTDPLVFMSQSDRGLELAPAPARTATLRLASAGDLSGLRRFVRDRAASLGLRGRALDDLQIAASELASNVLVHTPGPGEVRVWTDRGDVVCEVSDEGPGFGDPFAGYRLPEGVVGSGRGLWLARQLCDQVTVASRPGRTAVRLHVELEG